MAAGEPRVDWLESNVLADMVIHGEITRGDAEHRLYQYWETRLTRRQAARKIDRSIVACRKFNEQYGDAR